MVSAENECCLLYVHKDTDKAHLMMRSKKNNLEFSGGLDWLDENYQHNEKYLFTFHCIAVVDFDTVTVSVRCGA